MRDPLFDPLLSGLHAVLDLRSQQHELTATNIANADTPGFRAHFIDFEKALPEVVKHALKNVHSGSDAIDLKKGALAPDVEEIEPPAWSLDGNSVVTEREVARLSSNALMYTGLARGLGRRMALLRFAATNGRA